MQTNPFSKTLLALLLTASPLLAEVKLASPFTSHMVLQREMPVPVWGTADPVQQAMIKDWRARWGRDFPFYLVQLPGQQNISNNPRVREEQATVLALPNTGMAVTIDLGEAKDVHPHNKAPLGERLTRLALANVYGRKIESSGPMFESLRLAGGAARIKFAHASGGLVPKGGALKGFQIAGTDQKFVEAEARIEADSVAVSSAQVSAPVAVRCAWDNYPERMGCNLFNGVGLPAAPFRTDTWNYPIAGDPPTIPDLPRPSDLPSPHPMERRWPQAG